MKKSDLLFETHPCFPDRVNTEFSRVLDDHTVEMRVWERGAGETLACGTGACAVAVASILNGYVVKDQPVTIKLLGGDLEIFWDQQKNTVFMTGLRKSSSTAKLNCNDTGQMQKAAMSKSKSGR